MNWKLIFQLSIFGLIMAFGTISLISETIEPAFWLAIFIFCAFIIAQRAGGKYFLHGLLVSLVNCVWITAAHIIFYSQYISSHPGVAKMSHDHPFLPTHPRLATLITGAAAGIVSGLILGLFAYLASLMVKKRIAAR